MTPRSHSRFLRAAATGLAAVGFALAVSNLGAQQPQVSTLPPTPPTRLSQPTNLSQPNTLPAPVAATPAAATMPTAATPPLSRPHRATVTFAAGLLDVRANDSSLNHILRQIAKLTGMKIDGGVVDERVFGNYGPANPATILATLLDGTNSNMVILDGPNGVPAELTLTARSGGVTPPSPDSSLYNDPDVDEPAAAPVAASRPVQSSPAAGVPVQAQVPTQAPVSGPPSIPQPLNNVNGSPSNTSPTASTFPVTHSVPTDTIPMPSTTPSSSGIVDAPNPPPPGSTTSASPNGVPTPQQIYQQLQAMQKAQQQTSPQSKTPQ